MTNPASEPAWPDNRDPGHDLDYQDTDPVFTCDTCGDEFEPWEDSYCGRVFMEKDNCRRCIENEPDPSRGVDRDLGEDR